MKTLIQRALTRWQAMSLMQRAGLLLALVVATIWLAQRAPDHWVLPGADATWETITRDGMVHVGMDASYPPFENVDAAGQFHGFDVDLARALGERWGVEVVLVNIHFDGLYDAMEANKIELIVSALPHDPMMTQDVRYSGSYFNAGLVLMAPAGGVASVDELAGRTVAVELGAQAHQQAKLMQRDDGVDLAILPLREQADVLAALLEGRADALICDRVTAYNYLTAEPELVMLDPPLTDEPLVIAAPIGARTTIQEVNDALVAWRDDGTLAAWRARWLRKAESEQDADVLDHDGRSIIEEEGALPQDVVADEKGDTSMPANSTEPSVLVDLSVAEGVPLFKKYAMFDSGLVPVWRYRRDAALFQRCNTSSLRMDLFIGERNTDLGNLVDEVGGELVYDWKKSDELVSILLENGVEPYYSWCYVPHPVQPSGGNWRSVPDDWPKYQQIMRDYASHYRELGSPLGYQEVYNEPINHGAFFEGDIDDYNTMYKHGATGLLQGDPDALVGGPSEALTYPPSVYKRNVKSFLEFVEENDLPLDFFSYHSYGYADKIYITKTHHMREALAMSSRFDNVELHMNEFNTVPPPWPYDKTILEQPALIPQILTSLEDLLQETDVSLVHWAQFLESGVDALGLVDRMGRLLPGFYAFELYTRMPAQRVRATCSDEYGCMASRGETRFSVLVWSKSDRALRTQELVSGIPDEFRSVDVCIVDADFLARLRDDPQQRLKARYQAPVVDGTVSLSGLMLGINDIIYIEGNARHTVQPLNPGLSVGRVMHWYPDRLKNSFAEFDYKSGAVYLGANGNENAHTAVAIEFELADCDKPLAFRRERLAGSADLRIRVDYRTAEGYARSVQYGGTSEEFGHGTGRAPDEVLEMVEGALPIADHAPEGWTGKGLISFWGQSATADYLETIHIAPTTSGFLDRLR